MKRVLALLLVILLLAGCVYTDTPGGTEDTTVPTQTTEPPAPGLYDPKNPVEQQTAGAVRAYPLDGPCDGLLLMGDRLLLYYLNEQLRINAFSGDELTLETTASHHLQPQADGQGVQVTEAGLSYYNPGTNTLVILDDQLREKYSVSLPIEIQGIPVVNEQMDTVYYCTSEGIRAMDLETGIAHMLRQQENFNGGLYQTCFDGKLLVCTITDSDGSTVTEFVQSENGLQVGQDAHLQGVKSYGSLYFLYRDPEDATIYQFGSGDGDLQVFTPGNGAAEVVCALELGGVLTVSTAETAVILDFYDLSSGLRTASVTMEGVGGLSAFTVDPRGYVWFLDENHVLYRWEVSKSDAEDETLYTSPWYTSDAPNTDGLVQCQADADAIAQKFGVEIRIWKAAVEAPWDDRIPEHRVAVYEAVLPELEATLGLFPKGFLEELGSICDSGVVRICLVADTSGELGQQEWLDGNAYIAVEVGDDIRAEILRALYRVMDTYVLGETSMLDEWDAEKPAEDRAELFVEAMASNNGEYFEAYGAQSKLRTLCRAIRRAFGLRQYESELPWEQYLDDPLY